VRFPAWIIAYAVTLALLGVAYVALVFALAALVTVVVALVQALNR
jgi:hypothetical protein